MDNDVEPCPTVAARSTEKVVLAQLIDRPQERRDRAVQAVRPASREIARLMNRTLGARA